MTNVVPSLKTPKRPAAERFFAKIGTKSGGYLPIKNRRRGSLGGNISRRWWNYSFDANKKLSQLPITKFYSVSEQRKPIASCDGNDKRDDHDVKNEDNDLDNAAADDDDDDDD